MIADALAAIAFVSRGATWCADNMLWANSCDTAERQQAAKQNYFRYRAWRFTKLFCSRQDAARPIAS